MILDTVLRTLKLHDAIAAGEIVIVAVSGGGDSVALLHVLDRLKEELGIDLHVASLNHGIRAEAGRQDLDFVARLATSWNIPFTVDRADVPQFAREWGIGVEEAARRARYAFLARVAREQGSKCLATGHHALDQAETILMNIVRGSGTPGLRGMRVVSDVPEHAGMRLVRPLLRLTKDDLMAYCLRHRLPFRIDASNDDTSFRRNFVRHEIISRLRSLNPNLLDAFDRLAETAAVDEDFIALRFDEAVMPMLSVSSERWSIGKDDFAALHPSLQRRLVRRAFGAIAGASAIPSYVLTLDLIAWAQDAGASDRRDMNAVAQMRMEYDELHIERKDAQLTYERYRLIPADTDEPIRTGCPLRIHGLSICLSTKLLSLSDGDSMQLPQSLELRLRTRRPGDRFKPKGMGGRSRKIKEWMIDRKIPRDIRSRIPMVCADGAVIAICAGAAWHLADISSFEICETNSMTLWLA